MHTTTQVLYGILNQSHNISVNLALIHAIGNNEAMMFQTLISKHNYYAENGMLDNEGYFYATGNDLLLSTGFSAKQQCKIIQHLEETGLILTKRKGIPAKKYFKLAEDTDILNKVINKGIERIRELKAVKDSAEKTIGKTSFDQMEKLESTKGGNKNLPEGETGIDQMEKLESTKSSNKILPKVEENNIYKNINNKNNINKSIHQSISNPKEVIEDNTEERDRVRERIAENINIYNQIPCLESKDILESGDFKPDINDNSSNWQSMYFEAFNIICDVVNGSRDTTYTICRQEYPSSVVRSVFLKLTEDHVCNVLENLMRMKEPVRNIRKFLISSLYNSYLTLNTSALQGSGKIDDTETDDDDFLNGVIV